MHFWRIHSCLWFTGVVLAARAQGAPFGDEIKPLLEQHCVSCHSEKKHKGDLNLERFGTLDHALKEPRIWQQVIEQIEEGEMPPDDEPPLSAEGKEKLLGGVRAMLHEAALANAGDPGPVVLRRLSNAEYTWTLRDLTGVGSLDPAHEFPVDGAAGEGFTNAGAALVMSPALVSKYLEAAKEVAAHAMLLPDGIEFSPHTTRRDWTEVKLAAIREIYSRYSVPGEGMALNLQGLRFQTLDGGSLPLERYFAATLEDAGRLAEGQFNEVAVTRQLSGKYLKILWEALNEREPSYPMEGIRELWRASKPGDGKILADAVKGWQQSLWRFHSTGQIGKPNGPKSWQEAVTPIAKARELRLKIPGEWKGDAVVSLVTQDARDGSEGDAVRWEKPRLLHGKLPPIPLQQVTVFDAKLSELLDKEPSRTLAYLEALEELKAGKAQAALAAERGLDERVLQRWLDLTGISGSATPEIRGHFKTKLSDIGGFPAVKGWGSAQTPSMTVNAAGETVRFSTLTLPPRSVSLHPSPDREASIVWRSPIAGKLRVSGEVADADGSCGNGVAWRVDRISRSGRLGVAAGMMDNGGRDSFASEGEVAVEVGDLIALGINPRDGQHVCDTTQVSLVMTEVSGGASWDLKEVIDRVDDGNPLADTAGHPEVWHFCATPLKEEKRSKLPEGSALAKWVELVTGGGAREEIAAAAKAVQDLQAGAAGVNEADLKLRTLLADIDGPMAWGVMALRGLEQDDLRAEGPGRMDFKVPARLAKGAEVVVKATLESGSVVTSLAATDRSRSIYSGEMPVLTKDAAVERVAKGFEAFHSVFPAALCYSKIVPVDEVVTLRLFYREDGMLQRLVLDEEETSQLDRLWDELDFVSLAPLKLVDAYEQLAQYVTQGGNPHEIEPLRKSVMEGAERFRAAMVAAEPGHVERVISFADRAWRRPLTDSEKEALRNLYRKLRTEELEHEDAVRLVLARVLTAPAFLYKMESPGPERESVEVSDHELATRLSYFLTSSGPDERLMLLAKQGRLKDPDTLAGEASRLLGSPHRLAIEFGTQWLHVRGIDQLDEKSETVFPEFAGIRNDLNEEPVRFFEDFFRSNASILGLLEADHVFVNGRLAKYYGIEGVEGAEWQRVDGVREKGRGGILGFGATLAKQSGASRTSPILRGTWVCETLLGEHLPPPPKDVPLLPEQPPANLSERELTEMHANHPACSRCHAKIDPYGFSLEHYDAIGRFRALDLTGKPVNAKAETPDGKTLVGIEGLRSYLAGDRKEDFVGQFCRKLLGYALGRGVLISDEPLLEEIETALAADGYRVGIAVDKIVRSKQFREIRGKDHPNDH